VAALREALRLPAEVCAVLAARGHTDPEEAKLFLRPRSEHLHDPAGLADGPSAAERIAVAVERGEVVLVHGDYDVDGICAAALYTRYLRALGAKVIPFVPHRVRDGYDLSGAGLEAARGAGASLVVTADCGTTARDTVAAARTAGMDVVVTDHHAVGAQRAPATALVNPQRPDCAYPDKGLCGAGVAFKVCELVGRRLGASLDLLHGFLDLVALATVADLVPLRGENRVLVRLGLRRFADTRVPGLKALMAAAGVDPAAVDAGALGFVLAPRINAAGRLGDAADGLALLLAEDPVEARGLAAKLEGLNRDRREEDRRTLEGALELLARDFDPARDFGVVLASEGWHPGVIGIVASRVVERIHRPTVLVALDGDGGRGSARSIPGFHLHDALVGCAAHLRRFGGHAQAAGMDVAREAVPAFREAFNRAASEALATGDLRPVLRPDLELGLPVVDLELVRWLDYLGPHGVGNPRPLFLVRDATVSEARRVGENHLKVSLRDGRSRLDGIGFGLAGHHPPETLGKGRWDLLVRLERNVFRGVAAPQARIVDLRPAGEGDG
jgi:single-stranded-DNA-specific exonuclease